MRCNFNPLLLFVCGWSSYQHRNRASPDWVTPESMHVFEFSHASAVQSGIVSASSSRKKSAALFLKNTRGIEPVGALPCCRGHGRLCQREKLFGVAYRPVACGKPLQGNGNSLRRIFFLNGAISDHVQNLSNAFFTVPLTHPFHLTVQVRMASIAVLKGTCYASSLPVRVKVAYCLGGVNGMLGLIRGPRDGAVLQVWLAPP